MKKVMAWMCATFVGLTFGGCGILGEIPESTGAGTSSIENSTANSTEISAENGEFSVHFLELGNKYSGDCTLIKSGDTEVLIDAGSRKGSAETLKTYIDEYCTDGVLEYVIATHAHEDHVGGLSGALTAATAGTVLSPVVDYNSKVFRNFAAKAEERAGGSSSTVFVGVRFWFSWS